MSIVGINEQLKKLLEEFEAIRDDGVKV